MTLVPPPAPQAAVLAPVAAPSEHSPQTPASCALHRLQAHRGADARLHLVEHRLDVLRALALRIIGEDGNALAGSLRELRALADHLLEEELGVVLLQRLARLLGDLVRRIVGV